MSSNEEGLAATLFGPDAPSFRFRGEPISVPGGRLLALLCYLVATATEQPTSRDKLLELLWEDGSSVDLRQLLRRLRDLPGGETWLVTPASGAVGLRGRCDLTDFERAVAEARFADALAYWPQGAPCSDKGVHLLGHFGANGLPPTYQNWLEETRAQTEYLYRTALQGEAARALAAHDDATARTLYRQLLEEDPFNESAVQTLLELDYRLGNAPAALAWFGGWRAKFLQDIGIEPLPQTMDIYAQLERAVRERRAVVRERLAALPVQQTTFVGRESEVAAVRALLARPDCRLLTLLGPGGIGKTRLALEVARREAGSFTDGPQFVALEALDDPAQLPSALALALGVSLQGPGAPKDKLLSFVADKALLLVLDNFEQLTPAAPLVAALLAHSPTSKVLVTSRERLNLQGEHLCEVGGLRYPEHPDADGFLNYDAVRLFWQTAQRARADFRIRDADRPHVLRICERLGGMPLGLEFAASWAHTLSCQGIADELAAGNPEILSTSLKDVPERHRNFHTVFEKSWQMLSETEKKTVAELSVFRGGFSREAASAVTGASLWQLRTLADKTFIRSVGEGRYEMLAMVREFAEMKLLSDDYAASERHAQFFLNLANKMNAGLRTSQKYDWLLGYPKDAQNYRAALNYFLESNPSDGLRLSAKLIPIWQHVGATQEGRRFLERFINVTEGLSEERADALNGLGNFLGITGEHEAAQESHQQALYLSEQCRYGRAMVESHNGLGAIALRQRRIKEASRHFHKALELATELTDDFGMAQATHSLGVVAWHAGDFEGATKHYKAAIAIRRRLRDKAGLAITLGNLAHIPHQRGQFLEAQALYEESIRLKRIVGDRPGLSASLNNLGALHNARGEYAQAEAAFQEGMAIKREIGDLEGIGAILANLATLALARGDQASHRSLLQESISLKRQLGDTMGLAISLHNLASSTEDEAEALQMLEESVRLFREFGPSAPLATALSSLATHKVKLGMSKLGAELLKEGLDQVKHIKSESEKALILFGAANLAFENSVWEKALLWGKVAENIFDRINMIPEQPEQLSKIVRAACDQLGREFVSHIEDESQQLAEPERAEALETALSTWLTNFATSS